MNRRRRPWERRRVRAAVRARRRTAAVMREWLRAETRACLRCGWLVLADPCDRCGVVRCRRCGCGCRE
jgi:hypothetical protein